MGVGAFSEAQGLCATGRRVDFGDDSWPEHRAGPPRPGRVEDRPSHVKGERHAEDHCSR